MTIPMDQESKVINNKKSEMDINVNTPDKKVRAKRRKQQIKTPKIKCKKTNKSKEIFNEFNSVSSDEDLRSEIESIIENLSPKSKKTELKHNQKETEGKIKKLNYGFPNNPKNSANISDINTDFFPHPKKKKSKKLKNGDLNVSVSSLEEGSSKSNIIDSSCLSPQLKKKKKRKKHKGNGQDSDISISSANTSNSFFSPQLKTKKKDVDRVSVSSGVNEDKSNLCDNFLSPPLKPKKKKRKKLDADAISISSLEETSVENKKSNVNSPNKFMSPQSSPKKEKRTDTQDWVIASVSSGVDHMQCEDKNNTIRCKIVTSSQEESDSFLTPRSKKKKNKHKTHGSNLENTSDVPEKQNETIINKELEESADVSNNLDSSISFLSQENKNPDSLISSFLKDKEDELFTKKSKKDRKKNGNLNYDSTTSSNISVRKNKKKRDIAHHFVKPIKDDIVSPNTNHEIGLVSSFQNDSKFDLSGETVLLEDMATNTKEEITTPKSDKYKKNGENEASVEKKNRRNKKSPGKCNLKETMKIEIEESILAVYKEERSGSVEKSSNKDISHVDKCDPDYSSMSEFESTKKSKRQLEPDDVSQKKRTKYEDRPHYISLDEIQMIKSDAKFVEDEYLSSRSDNTCEKSEISMDNVKSVKNRTNDLENIEDDSTIRSENENSVRSEFNRSDLCDISPSEIKKICKLDIMITFDVCDLHRISVKVSRPKKEEREKIKALNLEVKTGPYTKEEDELIKKNWEKFCEVHSLDLYPGPFLQIRRASMKRMKVEQVGRFLQFIGHGLDNRLLCSVYERFKRLFFSAVSKTGRFTPEEDEIILNGIKNPRSKHFYTDIASKLNRDKCSIEKRYKYLMSRKEDIKSNWNSDKTSNFIKRIIKIMKVREVEDLKDLSISTKHWEKIASKLPHSARQLQRKWDGSLHTELFSSGQHTKYVKKSLIKRFYKKGYTDWKQINWNKIAHKYEGYTGPKLYSLFKNLVYGQCPKEQHENLEDCIKSLYQTFIINDIDPPTKGTLKKQFLNHK